MINPDDIPDSNLHRTIALNAMLVLAKELEHYSRGGEERTAAQLRGRITKMLEFVEKKLDE